MIRMGIAVLVAAGFAETALAASQAFLVTGFDRVAVAGPFDVQVSVGKGQSVRAEGAQADLDRLKVEVRDGKLVIGAKDQGRFSRSATMGQVKVYVTVPSLRGVTLAGSGNVSIDRNKTDSFAATIAGSGDLTIGNLEVGAAKFSIAGSGNMRAAGRCTTAVVSIAGSGNAMLGELRCQTVDGSIAGSGNIDANASRVAKLSVMGSGDVTLAGGARCDINKMGSGRVRCG